MLPHFTMRMFFYTTAMMILCLGDVSARTEERHHPLQLKPAPWMQCVDNVHAYFRLLNKEKSTWLPNPCGFSTMSRADVQQDIFFHRAAGLETNSTKVIAFTGDSTTVRPFSATYNIYIKPPTEKESPAPKIGDVPSGYLNTSIQSLSKDSLSQGPTTELQWHRFTYASSHDAALRAIRNASEGGVVLIGFGSWEVLWQHKVKSLAELSDGYASDTDVDNVTAVTEYLVKHMRPFFQDIARVIRSIPPRRRPIILLRELSLPNCWARRWGGNKQKKRVRPRCITHKRRTVVPLYRRVVSSLAWSLGIPVIPHDNLFQDNYRKCGNEDGIHLNPECYQHYLQIMWNVVRLMQNVRDGKGALASSSSFPAPAIPEDHLRQGYWQDGIEGKVADILETESKSATLLPAWSCRDFVELETFDTWRGGFNRSAPGGVDASVLLDQTSRTHVSVLKVPKSEARQMATLHILRTIGQPRQRANTEILPPVTSPSVLSTIGTPIETSSAAPASSPLDAQRRDSMFRVRRIEVVRPQQVFNLPDKNKTQRQQRRRVMGPLPVSDSMLLLVVLLVPIVTASWTWWRYTPPDSALDTPKAASDNC